MRSIEKNRKQRFTYLPTSIKWLVKIAMVVLGFSIWGSGFIWALLAWYILLPVIRGILCMLVGMGAIILFLFILLSFL